MSKSPQQDSPKDGVRTLDVCDVPQLSRMACTFCRSRKLRCDKAIPTCGSCTKFRHQCVYEAVRRVGMNKSRKKGYVSALQERLAQIETSLLKQETKEQNNPVPTGPETCPSMEIDSEPDVISQETIRELEQVYFQKIHESMPMLHRARYLAATELELGLQPPIYLRHAILALAACVSQKHSGLRERFYRSSREALEFLEMNDHQLDMVSMEQAQTWILIATYEFRGMHFHRSWMSIGRAVRLVQMMGLHCMDKTDSSPLLHGPLLAKPKDWTTGEERRRTFWMAFSLDQYSAIGHGWPMTMHHKDIVTRLPAPDEAFQSCTETTSLFLREAMTPEGAASLSPFAGLLAMTCICSQRLIKIRRFDPTSSDQRGLQRSAKQDSTLTLPFPVPEHLRVPSPNWDPNLYFLNMVAHASTIRVHQEAFAKTEIEASPKDALKDSERVRIEAAIGIASIMRASCHRDLSAINPFTSFCLYVAATALARPKYIQLDENQKNSLQFLLTAMNYLEEVNPLTTAFIQDLTTEFPDLTASFSGLNVGTGVLKDESSPKLEENLEMDNDPTPVISQSENGSAQFSSAFASRHSILGQEWADPSVEFDSNTTMGDDFQHTDATPDRAGDGFSGDMFLFPRVP